MRLRSLERSLGALFKPEKKRQPDTQRKFREECKRLAAQLGSEIERHKDGTMMVWPPKDLPGDDPFDGDHFALNWEDALPMLRQYAEMAKSNNG